MRPRSNLVSGDTNGYEDAFIRDLVAGNTTRVSVSSSGVQGNSDSEDATISADWVTVLDVATTL